MMSFPARVQAVVLGGGKCEHLPLEPGDRPASKGWLRVGGVPLARRTLEAVSQTPSVESLSLVLPGRPEWAGRARCLEASPSLMGSFEIGVNSCQGGNEPVLVCCGDLPFVTPESLEDFVRRCARRPEASLWYGFLRRENSQRKYPRLPHTWAHFQDGVFCGSGVMMLRPEVMHRMRQAMERLTLARKNLLRLAGCLGWGNLLNYALGRLTVVRAEKAGHRLFGVTCAGVETPYAELGFNVDDAESLSEARRILREEGKHHVPPGDP